MKGLMRAACAVGALVFAAAGVAQTAEKLPPEQAFGAREHVLDAALSPDGTKLSYIGPLSGPGNALYIVSLTADATPRRIAVSSGDPELLDSCGWVSNERLACTLIIRGQSSGQIVSGSRLLAVDVTGKEAKVLTRPTSDAALYASNFGGRVLDWLPGENDAVLLGTVFLPEQKLDSNITKSDFGYGVERVNTRTLRRERTVKPQRDANEYITDGLGNVRIVGLRRTSDAGYATGSIDYRFRAPGSSDWKPLSTVDNQTLDGFDPYGVDPAKNVAYGFDKKNGRRALYTMALDGTGTKTLVYGRDDVDVDGLIRLGRKQRIVGYTYATDKRVGEYTDPELAQLRSGLSKAMPNAPIVNFQGASLDEQKLLLWAGSDNDPGKLYLFDKTGRQLQPLLSSRPELAGYTLANVKPVQIRARDGVMIPGYLTMPPGGATKGLPAIVMPHGGPSARDEWGFDWLSQYYAHQGYVVLQPNYRGSAGYGDNWLKTNAYKSWRSAINDVVDAGKWLVSEGIADPAKLGIVGWSYGGYAALQSGVVAPDVFKAIVAVAPVTDLVRLREGYYGTSAQAEMKRLMGTGPELVEGSPAQNAAKITAPVLLFHGTYDQNVDYNQSTLMDDKLRDAGKRHQLVTYPKLAHSLDDDRARADLLKKSGEFLKAAFAK